MDYSKSSNKRHKRRRHPYASRLRNTVGVMIFRVLFAVILVAGFAAIGAGIGLYMGILRNAPTIYVETDIRPGIYNSEIIEARTGRVLATLSGEQNREFISIDRMPQHLLDAFIAIEDERFMTHNGIDPRGMIRALHVNLTVPDRVEGASTITQQLIKNMLGLVRNDLVSKLQEQYLAVQFERALTEQHGSREVAKEIILEAYLNMINLGRDWHGVQVAALNYFGKDASELTISESAVIAAITRNPSRYLPDRFPEHNRYRQLLVLDNMLRLEMITEAQHRHAVNDNVHDRIERQHIAEMTDTVYSYFVDAVISQVMQDLERELTITPQQASGLVFGGGLRIETTFDSRIQQIVDDVFEDDDIFPVDIFEIAIEYRMWTRNEITGQTSDHRRRGTVRSEDLVQQWVDSVHAELLTANDIIIDYRKILTPQPQAAFVIMDHHNGHVLAISGGRGEKTGNRHFCRARIATRSPGSQFKVLASFLPGVNMGMFSAGYTIMDEPWYHDDGHSPRWSPRNWWGSNYEGATSVRRAIYRSANNVSAIAYQQVGAEVAFRYLQNLGFTTLEGTLANGRTFRDTGASVPLGGLTLGVTQLELAAAYAAIANLGEYHRPVFYTRVFNHDGTLLLENGHAPQRVITAQAAYLLTDMMRDTVRGGPGGSTGMRANFQNLRMPIAGKTGTSQNVADLGFTGYTPYFTATVWLGFDTPRELPRPHNAHLDIWRTIMERVHVELELEHREFTRPDGVITGSICRVSNLLPTDLCRRAGTVVTDLFVVGTLPTAHCSGHREIWICTISGMPISHYCLHDHRELGVAPMTGEDGEEQQCTVCREHVLAPPGGWFPDFGLPMLPGGPGQFPQEQPPWWQQPLQPQPPQFPQEPPEQPPFLPPSDEPVYEPPAYPPISDLPIDWGQAPDVGLDMESLLPVPDDDDDEEDMPGWF